MDWRTATKILIVALTLGVVLYDLLAFRFGGVDATVSRVLRDWALSEPIVVFAVGVLIGHLFFPQPR